MIARLCGQEISPVTELQSDTARTRHDGVVQQQPFVAAAQPP